MSVENTATRDPMVHYAGVTADGVTGYITGMEADGTRQLAASTVLPIQGSNDEWFTQHGFTFGDPVDDLFREATLPDGWTRQGTGDSRGLNIVDERGIERVSIFYKAAFYDRDAFMRPINVGWHVANRFLNSDATEVDPAVWDALTDDERGAFFHELRVLLGKAERFDSLRYEANAGRARAVLEQHGESTEPVPHEW